MAARAGAGTGRIPEPHLGFHVDPGAQGSGPFAAAFPGTPGKS